MSNLLLCYHYLNILIQLKHIQRPKLFLVFHSHLIYCVRLVLLIQCHNTFHSVQGQRNQDFYNFYFFHLPIPNQISYLNFKSTQASIIQLQLCIYISSNFQGNFLWMETSRSNNEDILHPPHKTDRQCSNSGRLKRTWDPCLVDNTCCCRSLCDQRKTQPLCFPYIFLQNKDLPFFHHNSASSTEKNDCSSYRLVNSSGGLHTIYIQLRLVSCKAQTLFFTDHFYCRWTLPINVNFTHQPMKIYWNSNQIHIQALSHYQKYQNTIGKWSTLQQSLFQQVIYHHVDNKRISCFQEPSGMLNLECIQVWGTRSLWLVRKQL